MRLVTVLGGIVLAAILLVGCKGIPTEGERQARQNLKEIGEVYRPPTQPRALPALETNSNLKTFLQFAILNQPRVEAAHYDWAASIQRIAVERSLPDPRLMFESDIAEMVMSLMPGLMMDFPGPGKLKWAANVATAEGEAKYFVFENVIIQTAFALKKAYYELHFLDAKVSVIREMLRLLEQIEKVARTQNEVGKVTLKDVLRAQIEQEQLTQAAKRAAEARLSSEQIMLAVEFAEMSFVFRESSRSLALLTERLLPKPRWKSRSLATSQAKWPQSINSSSENA